VVQMLMNGRWQYQDAGIMDRGHLRFFTAVEIREMIEQAGLEMAGMGPLSAMPERELPLNPDGTLSLQRATIGPLDEGEYHDFLTYQYVAVAGKPDADRLAKARRALEARENETAYMLAQEAYGVDESERLQIMAKALARLGKLGDAEALYKKALEMKPGNASIKSDLGILYIAMNRQSEAKPYLEEAIEQDGDNDAALGALGLVHRVEGVLDRAFECFGKALEANFENRALITHLIEVADTLGRLAEIENLVHRFADFYPSNHDLAYSYAVLLAKLGKVPEAQDRLKDLLLLTPDHQPARQFLDSLKENEK